MDTENRTGIGEIFLVIILIIIVVVSGRTIGGGMIEQNNFISPCSEYYHESFCSLAYSHKDIRDLLPLSGEKYLSNTQQNQAIDQCFSAMNQQNYDKAFSICGRAYKYFPNDPQVQSSAIMLRDHFSK